MPFDQDGSAVKPPVPKKVGRHRRATTGRRRITAAQVGNVLRGANLLVRFADLLVQHEAPTKEHSFLVEALVKVADAVLSWAG